MKSYPTPHINAAPEDFAKTVLMPGDPLRSEFIAENFLDSARLVNNVRGIQGYTGKYKGHDVSVMASGMGMPSIGIYSYELYNFFGVENIIRVGSIGGMADGLHLRDIVFGMSASTTSNYAVQFGLEGTFSACADYNLLKLATEEAQRLGASFKVGGILSSDIFYNANPDAARRWASLGILGVEMEAAALYINAAHAKKRALAICTVSDHIFTGESLSAEERQSSFSEMIEIALNTACNL